MNRIARTALVLILLAAVPMTLAAVLSLDLSIGDSGLMTCTGQLVNVTAEPGQLTADCVELATAIPTPEPTATATPTLTPTAVFTPTPTSTAAPTLEPVNLLGNPDFADAFGGWSVDCTNCWRLSVKPSNPSPSNTAAESDQDYSGGGGIVGWSVGTDGRLWQDVEPDRPHSQVALTLAEVQHHGMNTAEIAVYGYDGSGWTELWSRLEFGDDVPYNTVQNRNTWYTNTYTVPVSIEYELYRVEFYSEITACLAEGEDCGWKFTSLVFEVND